MHEVRALPIAGSSSAASLPREESAASLSSQGGFSDSEGMAPLPPTSHAGRLQSSDTPKAAYRAHLQTVKRLLGTSKYPIECGGTVIGELPATFTCIPNAIKLRIPKES